MTPCETNPDLWFTPTAAREAERICVTECDRLAECEQEWANLPARQRPYGVWAGVDRNGRAASGRRITCHECGRVRVHEAKGLCRPCYRNRHKREKRAAWSCLPSTRSASPSP